ncbi:hypothetical protein F5X68DRAFT_274411 [Plectosphaerella plurivora]|uniref:Rhodopsin domain-containing protein n=1 Tax=Plectosphaerella plurivora TaxID=936078 RepID=A0A9P8VEK9_9PEZI|nr:hypothetical protein F5X68DRAFT_274411 [Plectosphaerella plurivora]
MAEGHKPLAPPSDLGMPLSLLGLVIPHAVCTLILLARLVARLLLLKKWFMDDSLIVAAYLFATAVCVIYSVASQRPDVLHADEEALQASLRSDQWAVHPYILRTYLGLLFYQVCLCLTKVSILTFYLRLFSSSRRYRRVVWATIIFVVAFGVPMLFMSIFQCHPRPGLFFSKPMYCFKLEDLLIASTSFHGVTDAWLLLMIMPSISGLDIPTKQKLTLSIVLNFGIFVITAGVVRLMLSLRKDYRPDMAGVTTSLAFFIMTVLECDLAIICASAPTLRPLFARFAPWIMYDARRKSLQPQAAARSRGRRSTLALSANLTSRVSYNGYPWTEPSSTPGGSGSRATSIGSRFNRLTKKRPAPTPIPTPLSLSHRSPTSVSLRSMMAKGGVGGGDHRSGARLDTVTSDGRPILGGSRPTSLAVSGNGDEDGDLMQPAVPLTPLSPPRAFGHPEWRHSEESLVMGLNDPIGTALSPAPVPRTVNLAAPERSYGNRREVPGESDGSHLV